jgi:hydrogenase maturation protease
VSDTRHLVIGVGNPLRGDDGAGLEVARLLKARGERGFEVLESAGEAASLLEAWGRAEQVVVVDALSAGGAPGRVLRLESGPGPLPVALRHASTHAFGLGAAIELGRALGGLPPRLTVYGIEGRSFSFGEGLSAEVAVAVEEVARLVTLEVGGSCPRES